MKSTFKLVSFFYIIIGSFELLFTGGLLGIIFYEIEKRQITTGTGIGLGFVTLLISIFYIVVGITGIRATKGKTSIASVIKLAEILIIVTIFTIVTELLGRSYCSQSMIN